MSTVGRSVGDTSPIRAYNPVASVGAIDPTTGQLGPATGSTSTSPQYVTAAQGTPTTTTITLAAGVAQTIIAANANIRGARILSYISAAPTYLTPGEVGTPASGAPSDFIPVALAGPPIVPAQFEFPYAPTNGVRAVNASGGTLTLLIW